MQAQLIQQENATECRQLPTFTSRWDEGKVWHYVDAIKSEEVEARTVVDFGLVDAKGRKVGMSRAIRREVVTLRTTTPGPADSCRLHAVGAPLSYFVGFAYTLRNGQCFGSGCIRVEGTSPEYVAAELNRRIERSRKLAARKFG